MATMLDKTEVGKVLVAAHVARGIGVDQRTVGKQASVFLSVLVLVLVLVLVGVVGGSVGAVVVVVVVAVVSLLLLSPFSLSWSLLGVCGAIDTIAVVAFAVVPVVFPPIFPPRSRAAQNNGFSALHWAVVRGSADTTIDLVDAGALINTG